LLLLLLLLVLEERISVLELLLRPFLIILGQRVKKRHAVGGSRRRIAGRSRRRIKTEEIVDNALANVELGSFVPLSDLRLQFPKLTYCWRIVLGHHVVLERRGDTAGRRRSHCAGLAPGWRDRGLPHRHLVWVSREVSSVHDKFYLNSQLKK